jgi:superfamily II DNA or RNA helicase
MPELREHQRAAVDAAVKVLSKTGRAQVVMACGTGKTLVGRAAAAQLTGSVGVVGVLVPSLALLGQTLRAWRDTGLGDFRALAVCSDEALCDDSDDGLGAGSGEGGVAEVSAIADLPVTTDPARIAAWLGQPDDGTPQQRVVFATYQSVPRIAEAYQDEGVSLPPFDLLVFDEAHRVAADPAAPFATALHDVHVPAARRLFLTATPRVQVADPDAGEGAADVFVGIDDEALFGVRAYTLSVAEAIDAGMLSDYRVLVVGVTDAEVHKLVLDNAPLTVGAADVPASMLAAQVALAGAAAEFDLRRILVFCGRVATSRRFARSLPHTVQALPDDRRPDGRLTVGHVDGTSPAAVREQAIADLQAPAGGGWSVVSNVKVFGEGVDCPALDAVVFADPRSGQIDVVQSVGRAIRLHPERNQPAVVLLPVYLAPGENGEAVLDNSQFRAMWQVLRALRDHDAALGAQIARARRTSAGSGELRPTLPERIGVRLPEGADDRFLSAFTAKVLDGVASVHERGFGRLLAFVEEFGHARPSWGYVDGTGFRLGYWAKYRRQDYVRGLLDPVLIAELAALPGWSWNLYRDRFADAVAAVCAYAKQHGCLPSSSFVTDDGLPLGKWVGYWRKRRQTGKLTAEQAAALESVPGWTWHGMREDGWRRGFDALAAFATAHGHCDVRPGHRDADGLNLYRWVHNQRYGSSPPTAERRTLLETLPGWAWNGDDVKRNHMIAAVAAYHAAHGAVPMPADYTTETAPNLGTWMTKWRRAHAAGQLDEAVASALEAIPDFTWRADTVGDRAFFAGLAALSAYVEVHGHADPPHDYRDGDGYRTGGFVGYWRSRYAQGKVPGDYAARLEALPGWAWRRKEKSRKGPAQQLWADGLATVAAFAATHGHTRIPGDWIGADGLRVGKWAARRRREWHEGTLLPERVAALEAIEGWTWNPTDQTRGGLDGDFSTYAYGMSRLSVFVEEHGHACPPGVYGDDVGFHLGMWVQGRRRDRARGDLDTRAAAALEALPGWSWNVRQDRFEAALAAVRAYAEQHGCLPSAGYVAEDGCDLGKWVIRARSSRRAGRLSIEDAARLESIPGWTWNPAEDGWRRGFGALAAQVAEYGHCHVHIEYRDADGFELGAWVGYQLRYPERLTDKRRALLESMKGWGWSGKELYRNRMVAAVTAFHAAHGPVPMPVDYTTDADPTVGAWMARARADHTAGRLEPDTVAALEAIGDFVWRADPDGEAAFAAGLAALRDYAEQHGHADPPPGYRDAKGWRIGSFVVSCRRRQAAGKIPKEQAALLEALPGWSWQATNRSATGDPDQRWAEGLAAVTAFAATHGHTRIPYNHVDADGVRIGWWTTTQRTKRRKGALGPERVAALEAVDGWGWDQFELAWAAGLAALNEYAAAHGTTAVPQGHVTADGVKLGNWVATQRANRRRGHLSERRAAALEAVPGWTWAGRHRTSTGSTPAER